jgi:predicted dehydrogenase
VSERISVGIIGCGGIAQMMYLPYLSGMPERFELKAVSDLSDQLVEAVCARYSIPSGYRMTEDLLADNLDAVFILTPYHTQQVKDALRAGMHVMVEKPLCFTTRDAEEIAALSQEQRRIVMVAYMKRYDPGYRLGVELIGGMQNINYIRVHNFPHANAKLIGDVYKIMRFDDVSADDLASIDQAILDDSREMIESDEREALEAYRMLLSVGSHDANALRGAVGNPGEVMFADIWNGGSSVMSSLAYGEEVRCSWEVSRSLRKWFDEEIAVYGQTAMVAIRFSSPFLKNAPTVVDVKNLDGEVIEQTSYVASYREAFECEIEDFHRCVVDDTTPQTDAKDAREDLVLLSDIVNAARRQRAERG